MATKLAINHRKLETNRGFSEALLRAQIMDSSYVPLT